MALSPHDLAILDFEREWRVAPGRDKSAAVRELFDLDDTAYYLELSLLIDDPEAYAHDPLLIRRLRRVAWSRSPRRTRTMHGPVLQRLDLPPTTA